MTESKRIKILETEYFPDNDLVYWTIQVVGDSVPFRLAMRGKEILDSFGIVGEVTLMQMKQFMKDIKGKEINWRIDGRMKDMPTPEKDSDDKIHDAMKEMDKDPFSEVIDVESKREC